MDFGIAIQQLKLGNRVTRKGWNGKGMSLYLEEWNSPFPDEPEYQPCIVMITAQGKLQPGWLASQADMLAEDWELV